MNVPEHSVGMQFHSFMRFLDLCLSKLEKQSIRVFSFTTSTVFSHTFTLTITHELILLIY